MGGGSERKKNLFWYEEKSFWYVAIVWKLRCACVCMCHNEKKCRTNGKHDKRHRRYFQVSSSKHNAKKIATRVRGPFHQSITAILTEEKREEKQFTKPTHVAVYLFRDLDRDRSRL